MRGERATLGKSLLDVQRELKIKAAISPPSKTADPSAFETPGFRRRLRAQLCALSGARPGMGVPKFCEESGFTVAHGHVGGGVRHESEEQPMDRSPWAMGATRSCSPSTPFVPTGRKPLVARSNPGHRLDAGAGGADRRPSAMAAGRCCKKVQQVQVAPIDQAPGVLPISIRWRAADLVAGSHPPPICRPGAEALDRLYRPQALDVPVLTARDAPIATLDPRGVACRSTMSAPGATSTAANPPDHGGQRAGGRRCADQRADHDQHADHGCAATVAQVQAAAEAGADIVRVSVPDEASSKALKEIVRESPVPIVADIHFHYKRGIEAAEAGAACLRINPGNIGDETGCARSSRPRATTAARSASA
jgi:hypothetical protein